MPASVSPRAAKSLFAATVFLGAGLVFQIQPLMSKLILPWFGGSPSVWTVCLLFFQTLLFVGYLYAHGLVRWCGLRGQWLIHTTLLALALVSPVLPAAIWKPVGEGDPTGEILLLLAWHVGLPYLLLSATGPLLQVWFTRAFPGESPYRLYALSNFGSLLGLVTYPFVVDVWLTAGQQVSLWYGSFVAYGLLCVISGWIAHRHTMEVSSNATGEGLRSPVSLENEQNTGSTAASKSLSEKLEGQAPAEPKAVRKHGSAGASPSRQESSRIDSKRSTVTSQRRLRNATGAKRGVMLLWFGLAMVPSVLLAAITNKLSTDVSPVPFLWVVPLALYLISLIICFSKESWANRRVWGAVSALLLVSSGIVAILQRGTSYGSLPFQFAVHLGTLFSLCMACHGELVHWKPLSDGTSTLRGQSLTEFYLVMSAGGAAGGLFVAVIAPAIFPLCVEYHLGLLAAALLLPIAWIRSADAGRFRLRNAWVWLGLVSTLLPLSIGLTADVVNTLNRVHSISRNFYGVLRVLEYNKENPASTFYLLAHGGTRHGLQLLDPTLCRLPTTYFGLTSGVGLALTSHHVERPSRVGVVGLGVGTIATYGRKGGVIDFYEIDPAVRDLATNFFRYLGDSAATIQLIPGDARLSLERREPQRYDVLVLDAFSGDAIPIHLLTAEAFEVYRRHLAPDGILAVHVSNQYFNLRPVLAGHARRLDWTELGIADRKGDPELFTVPSMWVLLSPSAASLEQGPLGQVERTSLGPPIDWTDARHSLFEVLSGGRF